ncbi:type IV secretory system conjugative DNA transfer family protein [Streptosporangium sp. NPDC023825]|uniref:type IV secretory system conjugative DNA transfer family protein n=1 Tax=Streptosporangium sp. NPDC023825 TaxID=3154909 RepID=UPI003415FE8E
MLAFMLSPDIVTALTPRTHDDEFRIVDFLHSRDTLYLVASAEAGSTIPPLLCALLAELKHEAVLIGSTSPAGRLDPPLSMELDEVANVTPIPIPSWASYAAGSGIRLGLYSQSWAQPIRLPGVIEREIAVPDPNLLRESRRPAAAVQPTRDELAARRRQPPNTATAPPLPGFARPARPAATGEIPPIKGRPVRPWDIPPQEGR